MDDDELLRALTRIAQQDPATDPRWRKLSEETLPPGDHGPLDVLASRSLAAHEAREAFVPLDDATRARLTAGILSQIADAGSDAAPPASLTRPIRDRESGIRVRNERQWGSEPDGALADAVAAAVAQGPEADSLSGTSLAPVHEDTPLWSPGEAGAGPAVAAPAAAGAVSSALPQAASAGDAPDRAEVARSTPRQRAARARLAARATDPRSRARAIATGAGWLAAGALMSLLALRPAPFAPGAAPMPAYTMAASVGERLAPGDATADTLHLARGGRLTLVLTPGTNVRAPVAVKAFLAQGSHVRPWPVDLGLDGNGGARISGTREALFPGVAPGSWEIVVAVGQPDALPAGPEAVAEMRSNADAAKGGSRLVRRRITLD